MKYQVEYYTIGEALRFAVVDSPNEVLIPFKFREKGISDLRRVKSSKTISEEEYKNNTSIPSKTEVKVVASKLDNANESYKPSPGFIFIKYGEIGKQYVIGDVVYKLLKVGDSSVEVSPIGGVGITISPYSQAILKK